MVSIIKSGNIKEDIKRGKVDHTVDEKVVTSAQIKQMTANEMRKNPQGYKNETRKMLEEQLDKMGRDSNQQDTKKVYDKVWKGVKYL